MANRGPKAPSHAPLPVWKLGEAKAKLSKVVRLDEVDKADLQRVVDSLNHRPRKRLGFASPAEAYKDELRVGVQAELWHSPPVIANVVLH